MVSISLYVRHVVRNAQYEQIAIQTTTGNPSYNWSLYLKVILDVAVCLKHGGCEMSVNIHLVNMLDNCNIFSKRFLNNVNSLY
jgi:hypothetical protein